jgi:hypothetical protein
MRGAHPHHFVGTGDDLRYRLTGGSCGCDGFDYCRVIAAEIGEDELDTEFVQRVQQSRACRIITHQVRYGIKPVRIVKGLVYGSPVCVI